MLEYLLPHFIVIVALMMFRSGGNLHSNAAPDDRPRPPLRRPALELTIKSGPDAGGGQPPTRNVFVLFSQRASSPSCAPLFPNLPTYSFDCLRFQSRDHDFGIAVVFMERSKVKAR